MFRYIRSGMSYSIADDGLYSCADSTRVAVVEVRREGELLGIGVGCDWDVEIRAGRIGGGQGESGQEECD